jgi:hypothetical protein
MPHEYFTVWGPAILWLGATRGKRDYCRWEPPVAFLGDTDRGDRAMVKRTCRNRTRTHYVRMPDLEDEYIQAQDKLLGASTFLKKYGAFTLLVIDDGCWTAPVATSCACSWSAATAGRRRCSARSISSRTGTRGSGPASTPTRSWTGSSTTRCGSGPEATTCVSRSAPFRNRWTRWRPVAPTPEGTGPQWQQGVVPKPSNTHTGSSFYIKAHVRAG